jgi:hypothetical protein
MLPQPNTDDETCIADPVSFFTELGHLHDADVTEFQWNPINREIVFVIDDLYANFLDLPEYENLQAVRLILSGISRAQIDVASEAAPLRVRSFEVTQSDTRIQIVVTFEHDGSIQIQCNTVACRPVLGT